jgi:thiol-disulfide isomerase/thioredoxin
MKTKTIILIAVLIMIVGSIYYLESQKVTPTSEIQDTTQEQNIIEKLKDGLYPKSPELVGISGYLNTEEIKISDLEGKVVLVDFWTYTCINCIRTLPFLTAWDEKYRDNGLVIIGVHTPEFEFEKKYDNVQLAIEKYNIEYPVVQDNDYATWKAFKNRFWPHKYLIDSEGYVIYDHIGEGGYEETELKIQELLAEIGEDVSDMETEEEGSNLRLKTTPELYAGYNFALNRRQNIGNNGGLQPDETTTYEKPSEIKKDTIYLEGEWMSNPDDLTLISDTGSIFLEFQAAEVNIVSDSSSSTNMKVYIDRTLTNSISIDEPILYNVYNDQYGTYLLELQVEKGFKFNAFTFGG